MCRHRRQRAHRHRPASHCEGWSQIEGLNIMLCVFIWMQYGYVLDVRALCLVYINVLHIVQCGTSKTCFLQYF